jgi:hypothetical protein
MNNSELLVNQALETYNRLTRRLETALDQQRKMPTRASRTTAYAAFQGRINRLRDMQKASFARYIRRKNNAER